MLYSLLLIAFIVMVLVLQRRWKNIPSQDRPAILRKWVLYCAAAAVILLVLAGRAPWLMGVLAALLALSARIAQFAAYIPLFKKLFGHVGSPRPNGAQAQQMGDMSRTQAADILGVDVDASEEDIRAAHKRLMQKIHPDRGGSETLAKQINQAKETLLS